MDKIWQDMYDAAKAVLKEKVISDFVTAGGVSAAVLSKSGKIYTGVCIVLFYFTAENRVDFRELVKDLAAVFRTRIELRQIGVRDEAKILGGLGICGREFCCKAHMGDFNPVSIKMAKEQGLSLNPTKISGTCGRLMCCLKNEQAAYDSLLKITPKVGAIVVTPDGDKGRVEDANLITGKLRIKTEKSEMPVTLDRSEVKLLKDVEVKLSKEAP